MHLTTADVSDRSLLCKVLIYLYLLDTDNVVVQVVSILAIHNMKSFWQIRLHCHIIK